MNSADFAVDGSLLLVAQYLQFTLNRGDMTFLVYKTTRTSFGFSVKRLLTLMF